MTLARWAARRITAIEDRFLDRLRSADSHRVATEDPTGTVDALLSRPLCVLVTYRKDGTPVPSPVSFVEADGRLLLQTGGWKVVRIAANSAVRVAPSTFRGRPLGAPIEATARILRPEERPAAEALFMRKLGPAHRIYHSTLGRSQRSFSEFVEITLLDRPRERCGQ